MGLVKLLPKNRFQGGKSDEPLGRPKTKDDSPTIGCRQKSKKKMLPRIG
jgi:hypothetical protein